MRERVSLEPVDAAYVTVLVDNFIDALLPSSEVAQRPQVASFTAIQARPPSDVLATQYECINDGEYEKVHALPEEMRDLPSLVPEWPPAGGSAESLTRRERQIAILVGRGFSNRRIASELSISEHTVATHVRKILIKLKLRSRIQISTS